MNNPTAVPVATIEGFDSLTEQQAFDMGARHLLTQKRKSERTVPGKDRPICVYDGGSGLTCGAGIFLKPEFRERADGLVAETGIEPSAGSSTWNFLAGQGMVSDVNLGLISQLQDVHDRSSSTPDDWADDLRSMAQFRGLNEDAIDEMLK